MMPSHQQIALLLVLSLFLLSFSACDSSPTFDDLNVDGEYVFEQLTFVPDATVLPAANVLDTLVTSDTRLEIYDDRDRQFFMRYRIKGETASFLSGVYTPTGDNSFRLDFNDNATTRARLDQLLMPRSLSFVVGSNGSLRAETNRDNVDLSAYSDAYAGLGPVDGTLRAVLVRR